MPNRAIVLAAGLGTRMRPYNGHIPKPLVEIGGKSLIDYSLDRLADAGVESVVVNVHHLADILERHLAPRQRPQIMISDERGELLGTGGGIAKALPKLGGAPFFLVNSDTVWLDGVRPNFRRLAEAFDPQTMDVLLLLATTTDSIGYAGRGDFAMLPDGRLRRRRENEVVPFVYAGAAIFRPRCSPMRRTAPFRSPSCSTAPPKRAGCSACGSKACGCMWARRKRLPPPKPRWPRPKGIC